MTANRLQRPLRTATVLLRLLALLALAVAGSVAVAGVARDALAPVLPGGRPGLPSASLPFDAAVGAAAGGALAVCWLWVLVTGLPFAARTALALCRGRQRPVGGVRPPRPVRVVVLLVLGAQGLALTAAGAASAGTLPPSPAPAPAARVAPPSALVPALLAGLPLPGRTTGALQDRTTPHHRAAPQHRPSGGEVVVAEGDSLWSIAARTLAPPGADDATVAACTARLRAANADRLGDDPDLIFPGTRLVLPSAAPTREEHR